MQKGRGRGLMRLAGMVVIALGAFGGARPALAQDQSPLNLPREGLDYSGISVGGVTVLPQVTFRTEYDNNLFATSTNPVDDARFELTPALALRKQAGALNLRMDNYANFRWHAHNPREDSTAFGSALRASTGGNSANTFAMRLSFDRAIESRGDPEQTAGPTDPPRRIDLYGGDLSYRHRFGNFSAELSGAADWANYNDPLDQDRDMATYRGALRLAYRTPSSLEGFVEGYVNRRDFRLATDFSGINRDTTTIGANVGVQRDIGQRLRGRIGMGIFRANPDSPALQSFSGLGVSGDLTWTPRVRTQVNLRLSRGDVATVRAGATGRIDTSVRIGVDQEIRHNLLGRLSVGYSDRQYRGSVRGHLKTFDARVELEYLMGRKVSLFSAGTFTNREARIAFDRFEKTVASLGIRYKF